MLEKDITFIYMDTAEKSFMKLLAQEAQKRGYKTKITDNKFEKCEVGIYCQHSNFPQFSKFSIIMLHDIIQQYGNWPDIWLREPWNKYDIGILPSEQWVNNWNQCSQWFYSRPRKGVYKVGWPKADGVANIDRDEYKKSFYEKYGLDLDKRTVLYAPAWENDNKQDEFVQAMLKLDVNILIKQWDAEPEKFPQIVKNIKKMEELHKNIERVTILPTSTNIFNAIVVSDILVSEESSTMSEAEMLGIPAVSVSNWLIPDVVPSRYPECNYDFVITTKKENLKECIREILENYDNYKCEAEEYAKKNFSNVGKASVMIIDILDDVIAGNNIRYAALKANKEEKISIRNRCIYIFLCIKRELRENYCERYVPLMYIWNFFKNIKDFVIRKKVK